MERNRILWQIGVGIGAAAVVAAVTPLLGGVWKNAGMRAALARGGGHTTNDRIRQFGTQARTRMASDFARAGVAYPPQRLLLLGLKRERRLEVYAPAPGQSNRTRAAWRFIRSYPILAASGAIGPKLREGDAQVPEGLYRIESLNPNSRFHVSLRVNYPNDHDRRRARRDRQEAPLGGDIMIHGNAVSIGCLAMGDTAAEELFTLAHDAGLRNIVVVLSPLDFRKTNAPADVNRPAWVTALYKQIAAQVRQL